MELPYFHVDAFTGKVFAGNPAGVCPLKGWLPDEMLQAIAAENRLSETAFLVGDGAEYELRWFTPETEVDLCGHATLAAAHVLFSHQGIERDCPVRFSSQSGELVVTCRDDLVFESPARSVLNGSGLHPHRCPGAPVWGYTLDFPARPGKPCPITAELEQGLGARPEAVYAARDIMAVFSRRADVEALRPDFDALARLDCLGIIVTAPDEQGDADFVSRFFAPGAGVPEDPVTGSAHCTLIPYWASRLGKNDLHALQVSARGGELFCEMRDKRVLISGRCVDYLTGTIRIPS